MRKTFLSAALVVLIGGVLINSHGAFAQSGSSTVPKNSDKPTVQAPVGHRQPRAGDVPNEKNLSDPNSAMNKEDAALDKKIKSICRGC
jgi:hypothetical protein